jgi:hypothetical protein
MQEISMSWLRRSTLLCWLPLYSAGCMTAHVLPPRAAPAAVMPAISLPSEQPPVQHGRVVIDVADGSMDVVAQRSEPFAGAASSAAGVGALCRTPCVRDLPVGHYDLFFSGLQDDDSRGDRAPLDVRAGGLNVLLRAPGKYETPRAFQPGPFALMAGGLAVGLSGAVAGPAIGGDGGAALALTALVASLGMIVAGLVIYDYRAEQQDGTSTYFQAAHRPAAESGSLLSTASQTR